jgi:hypothetical protein
MSWVDDLIGLGGDVVDMVGEVGTTAAQAWGQAQGANAAEKASQPETAQASEPIKGTNANGTPIVVSGTGGTVTAPQASTQLVAGIDNKYLLFAVVALIGLLVVVPVRGR